MICRLKSEIGKQFLFLVIRILHIMLFFAQVDVHDIIQLL